MTVYQSQLPAELNPAELQRNLQRYANDGSALQMYIASLRQRFEISVGMKVLEQRIREAGVRQELLDKVLALMRTEGELRRLPKEETVKDEQFRTQLLREQAEQSRLQVEIEDHREGQVEQREIQRLETELKKRQLQKQIADLDKEEDKEEIGPIEEHRKQAEEQMTKRLIDMEAEQKLKWAAMEAEATLEELVEDKLKQIRQELHEEAWETEGGWLENLEKKREALKDRIDVDVLIERYEKIRNRLYESVGKKRGNR